MVQLICEMKTILKMRIKNIFGIKILKLYENTVHSWAYTCGLDFCLFLRHKIVGLAYIWIGFYTNTYS